MFAINGRASHRMWDALLLWGERLCFFQIHLLYSVVAEPSLENSNHINREEANA